MIEGTLTRLQGEQWAIRRAPLSFAFSVIILTALLGGGIYWLVDHLYSARIAADEATLKTVTEQRDGANRENDKLRQQVAASVTAHNENAMPLKKQTVILADQLHQYKLDIMEARAKNDNNRFGLLENEWENRFQARLDLIIRQLDVNGQHSEKLDTAALTFPNFNDPNAITNFDTMSAELKRLADALPENL